MPVKIGKATTIVVDSTGLKVCGQGEWDATKHGQKGRRRWRKLHLCIDEGTLDILSHSLTLQEVGDSTAIPDLLDGVVDTSFDEFLGDGVYCLYDGRPVYDHVENHDAGGREVIVPPPSNYLHSFCRMTNLFFGNEDEYAIRNNSMIILILFHYQRPCITLTEN